VARVGPVSSDTSDTPSQGSRGFGIVGTGVIAALHAGAIASLPGARLVAVTDVAPGAASSFAAARGCVAEPGLDALLARPDVDVVCVCVPSGLHAEVGVSAARAGKHLVVEKPIDVTLAAADRLIAAARAGGVALTVMSQHRFDPGLVELKRLLGSGALGRLVLGEASTKWYRTQAYYDSAAWRGTWALDGGSLMNQGVHYVDLLRWCMGPVSEVTAVCATQAHQMEAEDTALAIVRFASGAVGTVMSSTAAYPGFPQRLEVTGTDGTVIVEDGQIVRRAFGPGSRAASAGGSVAGGGGAGGAGPGAAADPVAIDVAAHAAQIADLLAAIDEGREPAVGGEAGRDALEIVCAVYESARTGRTVRLGPAGSFFPRGTHPPGPPLGKDDPPEPPRIRRP
jgi:UDP-N-acetyl-2-amino-2-deoxyglucuronate dehydrogenase